MCKVMVKLEEMNGKQVKNADKVGERYERGAVKGVKDVRKERRELRKFSKKEKRFF